ncbi:hypothetical protein M885DRAFT_621401 [Pelagophyceae sp. CCMP2097]|nr:hypothetical protein M885DRAFT_621401 [Pelagophyceae sp. CCMP2097]
MPAAIRPFWLRAHLECLSAEREPTTDLATTCALLKRVAAGDFSDVEDQGALAPFGEEEDEFAAAAAAPFSDVRAPPGYEFVEKPPALGVVEKEGDRFVVRRDSKLRPFLGTSTDRTLLMVRSVDDQGEVEGWIAARLGARRDDDWSGLCHTQDALQRGMNNSVQRASPPEVGRPKNVALTVDTYKVTWAMLRIRPRPQRVQAPADGTPVRVEMVE